VDATAQLIGSLERRSFQRIGLGHVNGRYFLFHSGVGFDAAVVSWVERHSSLKRYIAHPLFVIAAFDTWLRTYDHSKGRFDVRLGTGEVLEGGTLAIVSKTSPYTYLGNRPLRVAPAAGLDTPLSVTVVTTRHAPSMLSLAAAALLSPEALHRHPNVQHRDDVRSAVITGAEPFPYQVDGDYLGEVTELAFGYEPDVLTLVVP
jgi:diacylglycerol kinase family enzyme